MKQFSLENPFVLVARNFPLVLLTFPALVMRSLFPYLVKIDDLFLSFGCDLIYGSDRKCYYKVREVAEVLSIDAHTRLEQSDLFGSPNFY